MVGRIRSDDDADQQDPAPHETQAARAGKEKPQPTGSVGGPMRFRASNESNAANALMKTMHSLIAHAKRPALVIAAAAALAVVPATAGAAGFGIAPGSFTTSASSTQAGAHAERSATFTLFSPGNVSQSKQPDATATASKPQVTRTSDAPHPRIRIR